ncbi:HAMP domain-containing sensor histidine kinase [Streptococcus ferus]|uniref:sensor histidine kinase n=1 Tax=Streptococcus ferus TaxID=1345 RepID=UPI003516AB7B
MFDKLRRKSKSENTSYFIHFFAVFSGIFLVMTVIILQVMRFGIYSSVDNSLTKTVDNIEEYVNITLSRSVLNSLTGETSSEPPSDIKPKGQMVANTHLIVYDKDGNALNSVDSFSGLQNLSLNTNNLKKISEQRAKNFSGQEEVYRTITVKVDSSLYTDAKYATVVVNTTQLEDANDRYVKIIVSVMAVFWLLSVGASVYLAKWSRKPILESYEKQKAFVENASHELRTPLAVLQNRLESLFRQPDTTILDNSENIASSLDEVRNMRILTTNLLNLARRDDGIKPEIVEIKPQFFKEIFQNYQMIAEENQKNFYYENQLTKPIRMDKTLLKQLMTILFDNAIKYSDSNGDISMTVEASDKQLLVKVADNGQGISDTDKSKIFDRFYRVDKARTRQKGGFGLGLSLAKQIVDSLKGSISVKDNQPKGSIFEVRLPLTK